MTETLIDLINSFKDDGRTAIIHNGEEISYDKFYRDIARISSSLSSRLNDKRVVIISENNYKFLVGIYSTIYSGGVAVPIDNDLPSKTIRKMVNVTDPNLILTDDACLDIDTDAKIFEIESGLPLETSIEPIDTLAEDTALILFTSGTTGNKKAVLLSHRNLIETSQYINEFMQVDEPITEHILVPIYHSFGFARTRCVFLEKGTVVLDDGQFNPLLALKRMINYDCDAFSGVPSVMAMLIEAGERRFSKLEDQIQHVEIGSAWMPIEHKEYLLSNLPNARVCMHYGLTEASRTCFTEFRQDREKLDSVGRPSPGVEVTIIDEEGAEVPTGEMGEIAVTGPNVAKGYLKESLDGTDKKIGEWFYTGDVGYKDEEGYVYFEGRDDDIINIGGEKVAPLEVEQLINETEFEPKEFCVVGAPDPGGIYGSIPVLCTTDSTFTDEDLQVLNKRLYSSDLKEIFRLRTVVHLDQIPRTDNGKILRNEVEEKIKDLEFS